MRRSTGGGCLVGEELGSRCPTTLSGHQVMDATTPSRAVGAVGPIGRDAVACPIEEALSIFGYRSERLVRDCGHTSPELFSRDAAPGAATYFDGCGVEHLIIGLTPT